MPYYEFECVGCPGASACEAKKLGIQDKVPVCRHEIDMPMSKSVPVGGKIPCEVGGCTGVLVRVVSLPQLLVKQPIGQHWKPGQTIRTKVGDQDLDLSFVDHPHTNPGFQNNLSKIAAMSGIKKLGPGLSNAYYDEKLGQHVVAVASNMEDPLGAIQRNKQKGNVEVSKTNVGQKVRTRKPLRKK